MEQMVHRVSTIVVGESDRTRVFHSLDEIPAELRRRLHKCVSSESSATLLIADERGRKEIMHKLDGGESPLSSRLIESIIRQRQGVTALPQRINVRWLRVAALTLLMFGALLIVGR